MEKKGKGTFSLFTGATHIPKGGKMESFCRALSYASMSMSGVDSPAEHSGPSDSVAGVSLVRDRVCSLLCINATPTHGFSKEA